MNVQRFVGLPNALKPAVVVTLLLAMILAMVGGVQEGKHVSAGLFLWFTTILQLVFMVGVCALFLLEAENTLTFGRDAWPVLEMGYSGTFACIDLVNTIILASWHKVGVDGTFLVAALFIFLVGVMHVFAGILMFRIWKGFVRSGGSQNPTPNVQPGDVGNMHPGV